MKRAVIYARANTEEGAGEHSLALQAMACQQLATQQGYSLGLTVNDFAGGGDLDRPCLKIIREMAAGGDLQAVIVAAPDRLSHNPSDVALLTEEFAGHQVRVLFVDPQQIGTEGHE